MLILLSIMVMNPNTAAGYFGRHRRWFAPAVGAHHVFPRHEIRAVVPSERAAIPLRTKEAVNQNLSILVSLVVLLYSAFQLAPYWTV